MFRFGRYNLRCLHVCNLVPTRLKLSTFNHDSVSKSELERISIQGIIQSPTHSSIFQPYDVIVVGGGHAGCEGK